MIDEARGPEKSTMTSDQLRSFLQARPFRPFVIHTADGRAIDVNHPQWLAYAGGGTAVVAKLDETFEVVDLLLVPSIELKPKSAPGSS
jgi:hypothetical protein